MVHLWHGLIPSEGLAEMNLAGGFFGYLGLLNALDPGIQTGTGGVATTYPDSDHHPGSCPQACYAFPIQVTEPPELTRRSEAFAPCADPPSGA